MDNPKRIDIFYTVRSPWKWVMEKALQNPEYICSLFIEHERVPCVVKEESTSKSLPSTTASSNRVNMNRKQPCTFRVEIVINFSPQNHSDTSLVSIKAAAHGTSNVLHNLEDKDELARTLQKWNCEHICPTTLLLPWDLADTHDPASEKNWLEMCKLMRTNFPILNTTKSQKNSSSCVVLKAPLGSRGEGIYFLNSIEDIQDILIQNKRNALKEKGFIESILKYKQRIPSWALQAEVYPPLLISEGKKFHLRSYLLVIEHDQSQHGQFASCVDSNFQVEAYVYHQHEVRIASESINIDSREENEQYSRKNRNAYITNGAGSDSTHRCLLNQVPELVSLGMKEKLEKFMAQMLGIYLLPEIKAQLLSHIQHNNNEGHQVESMPLKQFAMAGVDIMVDIYGQLYLLEVNVNPAAPPENVVDKSFSDHLVNFMKNLLLKVLNRSNDNSGHGFIRLQEILDRE